MAAIFEFLGVQRRAFVALLTSYLRIDLRAQTYAQATNSKPGEAIPPLYWVVVQFLTVSALLCAVLQARVPAAFYAGANLYATITLVFSAVVVEFHEAIINAEDARVVGHRPVTDRTWAMARLANLALYVGLMTLSLMVFPTIMGLGLRDTTWWWLVAYPLGATAAALFATSLALAVVLNGRGQLEGVRRFASWLQILAILGLFYGGQLMLRSGSGELELMALHPPWWWRVMNAWLGELIAPGNLGGALALLAGAAGLTTVTIGWLASRWRGVTQAATTPPVAHYPSPRQGVSLSDRPWSWFGISQRAQAITALAARIYARDGNLRTRVVTTLILPVSAATLGMLTDQYAPPGAGPVGLQVMPIVFCILVATATAQSMVPFLTGRDHTAAWQLRAVWDHEARRGVVWFLLGRVHAPLWLGHTALLLWQWSDPAAALRYTLVGGAIVVCIAQLAARTLLAAPIMRLPPRMGSGAGVAPIVLLGVSTAAAALGTVWCLVAHMPMGDLAFGVALLIAAHLVGRAR